MELRYVFRISANCRMTGTGFALARVFGWFTTVFQTERFTPRHHPNNPSIPTRAVRRLGGQQRPPSRRLLWEAEAENPEFDKSEPGCTRTSRPVRVRSLEYGLPDRIRTIERAFILRMSENAAEDALDMLQGGFAQVIFIGDCLQHSAGIHRSELTHTNVPDAIAYVIVPDFRVALFRRRALFFDILQIEFFDKFRERHPGSG